MDHILYRLKAAYGRWENVAQAVGLTTVTLWKYRPDAGNSPLPKHLKLAFRMALQDKEAEGDNS